MIALRLPGKLIEIAMIHLDAPKDYYELRPILIRFFGALKNGSIIVFQDFFIIGQQVLFWQLHLWKRKGLLSLRKVFVITACQSD